MREDLAGIRALVTRPAAQAAALAAAVRAAGGQAWEFPLLEIAPLDAGDVQANAAVADTLRELASFDLAIFISGNAVRELLARLRGSGRDWPARLACLAVGSATARSLREAGIDCASAATAMDSEELLAHAAIAAVASRRIVIFKGVGGRELLARELAARGARVTECALYRRRLPATSAAELLGALRAHAVNALLLSSGEALANLLGLLGGNAAGTIAPELVVVTPGERLAGQARAAGFRTVEVAANATDAAMLAALRRLAVTFRR
jgi:uroporphyrinogen-III synthase